MKQCLEIVNDLTAFLIQYENRRGQILETVSDHELKELIVSLDKFSIREDIRELQEMIQGQIY